MKCLVLVIAITSLAACSQQANDGEGRTADQNQADQGQAQQDRDKASAAEGMVFRELADRALKSPVPPVLDAQVRLDRLGFAAGVIDGKEGASFKQALRGFQEANDLSVTGLLDSATLKLLAQKSPLPTIVTVKIPAVFAAGPFKRDLPKDAAEQAKLPSLGYKSLMEALAERFHTTSDALIALNSSTTPVGAGAAIRVPHIPNVDLAKLGEDKRGWNHTLESLGVSPDQPKAEKVVVDKSTSVLRAFDAEGRLIAQFPATMGSEHDPLPLGTWKIQGISRNPEFHYNPKLFWDVSDSKQAAILQPGPNGPVGVVWLDLSKPHYGIHGTGEPQTIGRSESHGCVRLSNWDVARLAQMVDASTPAVFQR